MGYLLVLLCDVPVNSQIIATHKIFLSKKSEVQQ